MPARLGKRLRGGGPGHEIGLRLRGPAGGGGYGGAHVAAVDCAFYDTATAIRAEDMIERATVVRPRFGVGVEQRVRHVGGESSGFRLADERPAPPLRR